MYLYLLLVQSKSALLLSLHSALCDYGEPNVVKCCCLVFRECIRRPIHFDYIGESISTSVSSSLVCCFYEKDGEDLVKDVTKEHV